MEDSLAWLDSDYLRPIAMVPVASCATLCTRGEEYAAGLYSANPHRMPVVPNGIVYQFLCSRVASMCSVHQAPMETVFMK